eukprot:10494803-Alexandrium_andersonii.AAC.1
MERWRGLRERTLGALATGCRGRPKRIQGDSSSRGEECRAKGDPSVSACRGCMAGMPNCASCVSEPACPAPP